MSLFCSAVLCVLYSFVIISLGKERAGCFTFVVFLMSCRCYYLTIPHGAMGWSVVCESGIYWSYSLLITLAVLTIW